MGRCLESQNDVPKNWGNWKVSCLWNVALFLAVYTSFINSRDMPEGWHTIISFSENNLQGRWQAKQESQAHPAVVIHHTSVLVLLLIISLSHKHLLSMLLGAGNKPGQHGSHTEATLSPDHQSITHRIKVCYHWIHVKVYGTHPKVSSMRCIPKAFLSDGSHLAIRQMPPKVSNAGF